jgi:hypothetical protein
MTTTASVTSLRDAKREQGAARRVANATHPAGTARKSAAEPAPKKPAKAAPKPAAKKPAELKIHTANGRCGQQVYRKAPVGTR